MSATPICNMAARCATGALKAVGAVNAVGATARDSMILRKGRRQARVSSDVV